VRFKTFVFIADTIDGKILEFPKPFYLQCDLVKPLGVDIIRQYTKTECILAKKVFLIYYAGQVFGSTQFTGVAQFVLYLNSVCQPVCAPALITINGCLLQRNGCNVSIFNSCPTGYNFTRYGCAVTRNGCQVVLN
jgi:hypothetical protein